MATQFTLPRQVKINVAGRPYAGAQAFFYQTGTEVLQTVYQDAALTTPHSQPIPADDDGYFPVIWLNSNAGFDYRLVVLSGSGVQLEDIQNIPRKTFTSSDIATTLDSLVRTAAEIAADVTPVNYAYPPGHALRFAKLDGLTDDTAALKAWASVPGDHYFPGGRTAKVSDSILLVSSSVYEFGTNAIVTTSVPTISILLASAKSNVHVVGGRFEYTATGSTPYIGGVNLVNCVYCSVRNAEFAGMQWAGVLFDGTSRSVVSDCYIRDHLGTAQDSADICIYRDAQYNVVERNKCFGGITAWHGILVMDPSGSTQPLRNKILYNHVRQHATYGVVSYMVTNINVGTQIIGNTIEDIDGATLGGGAGAGIYVLGSGDVLVDGNLVKNCCVSTANTTGNPAGIAIAHDNSPQLLPCVVANNVVEMAHYYGIQVSAHEAVVVGNSVYVTGSTSYGIFVIESNNVTVTGNTVRLPNTLARHAILVQAVAIDLTNINVSNNVVYGGNVTGIGTTVGSTKTVSGSFVGNVVRGGGSGNVGMAMVGLLDSVVSNNSLNAATAALVISGCTGVRGAGNVLRSTTATISGAGTCSNCFFDSSNDLGSNSALIINGVAGIQVEWRSNAAPSGGNWQIGDQTENTAPSAAGTPGWVCTTAGTPGTWKARAVVAA